MSKAIDSSLRRNVGGVGAWREAGAAGGCFTRAGSDVAAGMSAVGTFRTCQPRQPMSVIGGRPVDICSMRVLRILTRSGAKRCPLVCW